MPQDLARVEGVTVRLVEELARERDPGPVELMASCALHELNDLRLTQTADRQALDPLLATKIGQDLDQRMAPVKVRVPVGPDDERPHALTLDEQVLEQQERRLVRPVQIIQDQDHRLTPQ